MYGIAAWLGAPPLICKAAVDDGGMALPRLQNVGCKRTGFLDGWKALSGRNSF